MNGLKRYLSLEIGIEFKACLYFFCILFFYAMYKILGGSLEADIIVMAEMICSTYFMGYIQYFLFDNFDEGKHFGIKEGILAVICSGIYTMISFLLRWYDRDIKVTVIFFIYILFAFVCAAFVYRIKRDIDTMQLNQDLEQFKKHRKNQEDLQ